MINELRVAQELSAVDLFAGPGGLSEGFWQAGFEIVSSVEMDKWAVETLRTRHIYRMLLKEGKEEEYFKYLRGEVERDTLLNNHVRDTLESMVIKEKLSPASRSDVLKRIESQIKRMGFTEIDVLLGGPPCELYSLIGRAKYASRREKYFQDERLGLYEEYVFFLQKLQPKMFVFENVLGILSSVLKDGRSVINSIIEAISQAGYRIFSSLRGDDARGYVLDSVYFGVPQRRRRVILVGYRKDLSIRDTFYHELDMDAGKHFYTVWDAIADLPPLDHGQGNDRWYGPYDREPHSEYAMQMREGSPGVLNHRARHHMQTDRERYRYFIERSARGEKADLSTLRCEAPELLPKHKNLETFTDRYRVQSWDKPSCTITSHLSKDGNYYIHPDIAQCRSFTVREAARCQSFPDNYLFEGPRTAQFKQVGSAVPPILARYIGKTIKKILKNSQGKKT